MTQEEGLLDFEEFRKLVGASEPSVRVALKALKIEPLKPFLHDRRMTRYRSAWAEQVRAWIEDNLK